MAIRRVRRRVAATLAAVVASTGVVGVVGTGVAAAAACTTTQLVPTQREFVVGQGLPGQTLVRGKETLVRVLLSLPDCATSRQSLRITSASLQVLSGTTPVGTGTLVAPTDATAGQLSPWAGGTKPSDPFFVVAPEVMIAATEGSFPLTFRATVAYSGLSGTTPVGGTATFSHNATVAQKSNAMRVLVVPMGDAAAVPRSDQFTASGAGAVQRALETVSRLFPVPCARAGVDQPCVVNDLGATSGGIRYEIDPGMVDVRSIANAYNANGKFCGGGSNFEAIKSELGQFLLSWNTANPAKPADRVLGVVDEAISEGVASSGGACVEGMAAPNSLVGWFRASYSSTATQTGGVLGMELAHTIGAVPFARSGGSYHSPNIAADGSAPGRGHNVTARTMLVGPRSAMRYSSDPALWNDNSTLLEPADQQYLLCQLGGPTTPECTTSGGIGTTNGIGAGLAFVMSGTTRGTADTTDVVESFFADVNQPPPPDPASPDPNSAYRLVQLDGAGVVGRNDGVRVTFDSSEHHHDGDGDGDGPNGLFSIAFDGFTGAGAVRLYKCAAGNTACITNPVVGGGALLYEVTKPASKPVVESTSVLGAGNVRNYTQDPSRDDTNPAASSSHVAWVAKCASCITGVTTIHVAPVGDRTKVAEAGWANDTSKNLAQTDPALRPDGAAMVYAVNGNLYTATINKTSTPPAIGTPKLIYAKGGANPAADTPTFSSDGATVFFHSTAGGILKVAATGGKASPLVSTPAKELAPSASPASGDRRVAYVKGNDVWLVDAANPSQTKRVVTNGASPAFLADGRIAFVRGGAIYSVKADGTDLRQLTNGTTDANPYGAGTTLAFDRPAAGGRDVFLSTVGGTTSSARVTSPVADRLVGEVLLTCPDGTVYPLAVGVSPVSVDGNTAVFDIAYDETLACGGNGTLTFVAIDGWFRSDPTAASKLAVTNTEKPPVAAISNPVEGATIRPSGLLSLSGTGTSAQDGSLSGGRLRWTVSGPGMATTQVGTGNRLDVPAPSGGWPVGTLTITLTATDSGGRTATDTRHVTVDGVGPQADLDSTPSDPGPSTATFSFTASDPTDPASDVTVLCGLDAATLEPCTSPVSFTNLSDGEHTFWLVAYDDNGNQSVKAFGWIVDGTGPGTSASTSPDLNADGWASTNTLTVTLTADDGGGSGVNRIVYSLTGAQTGGATVPGATATIPITTQGQTTVTFHAVDNVGNVEPDTTLVVGLDSGPPVVEILGDGLYFPGEKLIGCAADAVSGLKPVTVSYSGVGTPAQVTATYTGPAPASSPCGPSARTWEADLPPVGVYTATAVVTDLAGNSDTDTASVQVSVLA